MTPADWLNDVQADLRARVEKRLRRDLIVEQVVDVAATLSIVGVLLCLLVRP